MKEDLTIYDIKPEEFLNYLRYNGEHFNKKLCEFACKQFPTMDCSKDKLNILLQAHNIEIKMLNFMTQYIYLTGVKTYYMVQAQQTKSIQFSFLKMSTIKNQI